MLGMVKEAGSKHRGPRKEGDSEVQGEDPEQRSLRRCLGGAEGQMLSAGDQQSAHTHTASFMDAPTSHSESMGHRLVQERD